MNSIRRVFKQKVYHNDEEQRTSRTVLTGILTIRDKTRRSKIFKIFPLRNDSKTLLSTKVQEIGLYLEGWKMSLILSLAQAE